ncbi:uncharacterized protein LOC141643990 [Silene latifolia]|uniref:uncharacterized protein LOC141643990 n=1 Tax=Silene latifolia TaxID=37657 RepID=UPI003D77F95C
MLPPNISGNVVILSPEAISASGRSADKQSLQNLQSKMKCDPESYTAELELIYRQFQSSLELFKQQAALSFNSLSGVAADPSVSKNLAERSMFLSHMFPHYPKHLAAFPELLADLLRSSALSLPSYLRSHLTQALILLVNRKKVEIGQTLPLFMELQTLGDRTLKKLAYSHVIRFIQRMNKKHKDDSKNKPLQNILFQMLQREEESIAKRALVTLCELHRRKVWTDDRTVNAICMACFHPSSRIMIAALSFLLDFEKIQDDDDSDASSSDDEDSVQQPHVALSREDVYKANKKGTSKSKKKKKAKLERVVRSMKRQQRLDSEKTGPTYYSPLSKLKDAQGFAEKLFSRLQSCNERFEVKMMILKVVARTIGLHQLILLNFYSFIQKYVQPHQRDITNLLAAAVQACHEMVPPDAVEPLFRQIVNQFVHDRSRTEAIAVGLNVVREICLRMPLMMTEDLLQDLVLYRKSHEKAVTSAARSLLALFREVCPSLLAKKDRGRPTDPKARPKEYGEVNVATDVPGAELLQLHNDDSDLEDDGHNGAEDINDGDEVGDVSDDADSVDVGSDDDDTDEGSEEVEDDDEMSIGVGGSEDESNDSDNSGDDEDPCSMSESDDSDKGVSQSEKRKRKFADFDEQLNAAKDSLRALKKLTTSKLEITSEPDDHIYSNEDFKRIRELQAKEKVNTALTQHGLLKGSNSRSASIKIPSPGQLSLKPIDPAKFDTKSRGKLTKDQRIAVMKAGREGRDEYKSRTAVKKTKIAGTSNREKQRKKKMPHRAKLSKISRDKQTRKTKQKTAGKQFRGKKAWK